MPSNESKLRSSSESPERAPRSSAERSSCTPRLARRVSGARTSSAGPAPAAVPAAAKQASAGGSAVNANAGGCWDASAPEPPPPSAAACRWKKATMATAWAGKVDPNSLTFDALFKRYEFAKAFSLNSEQVSRDSQRVKKRLHDANRMLLREESQFMQFWDLTSLVCLAYTLLVSPYEIGFLDDYSGVAKWVLFWSNQFITVVFATDIVLNFFRPYRDALGQKVRSHRLIAQTYLRSWFMLDILSTIPLDLITMFLLADSRANKVGSEESRALGLIRILRLLKLFRIMRASRIFARWADRIEHYISISHATRTLLWWCFLLLTTIHWFCCGWGLFAQLHGTQRTEAVMVAVEADQAANHAGDFCDGCLPEHPWDAPQCRTGCLIECELAFLSQETGVSIQLLRQSETWICRAIAAGVVHPSGNLHHYRYLHAMAAFGQLTPTNDGEYVYAFFVAFAWLMMQNAFIGILCGTVADGDKHAKEYKSRMDELNYFLRDMQAPRELAVRARARARHSPREAPTPRVHSAPRAPPSATAAPCVTTQVRAREHCRSTRSLFKKLSYQKLFELMSPMLRGDLAQQMSFRTLDNVWYFQQCASRRAGVARDAPIPVAFGALRAPLTPRRLHRVCAGRCEPELLRALSERLQPVGYARGERIYYEDRLNIVTKGAAARGGKILTLDSYWGEDMIVTSKALKDTRYSSALTYVELTTLTREDLEGPPSEQPPHTDALSPTRCAHPHDHHHPGTDPPTPPHPQSCHRAARTQCPRLLLSARHAPRTTLRCIAVPPRRVCAAAQTRSPTTPSRSGTSA